MKKILALSIFCSSLTCGFSFAADELPQLLMQAPAQKFDILGPISATKKSVDEAQTELLFQGKKLDADAVILKDCTAGSIERSGLTWFKAQAACEGLAIRYSKIPTSAPHSQGIKPSKSPL